MLWGGGDFIAADCLIVWTKDGSSYVYKLPRMCCPGLQEAAKGNPYQEPTVIHKLALPEVPQSPGDCNDPAMFFSYGRRDPFYKMVMRGCSNGSVCIWKVKDEILETIKPVEGHLDRYVTGSMLLSCFYRSPRSLRDGFRKAVVFLQVT
ncbi:predicted protein [Nematostella vectensis]|uniref:Uncharacterized protein n=1 Tax=Nematostella vectensis TaxID=45351 RepID=A7T7A8_NEMVE|nr:predicted protein [Nematostella vectensis]|eukprot:XP_001620244.1 hypothetical protein NEMVEDRAFT_v1g248794 [Nematostella vectensis]